MVSSTERRICELPVVAEAESSVASSESAALTHAFDENVAAANAASLVDQLQFSPGCVVGLSSGDGALEMAQDLVGDDAAREMCAHTRHANGGENMAALRGAGPAMH